MNQKEFWAIFKNLSDDLKTALVSEDTSEAIWNISQICNIEKVSSLAKIVRNVLVGLLPPKNFREAVKKEFNMSDADSQKLEVYIQHYIFNPVSDDLESLYQEEKKTETEEEGKGTSEGEKEDVYREIVQ